MQSNNSELHNSNQKLVLHMWQEDSGDENHQQHSPENRKSKHIHKDSHRQHRHRNRHRHGGGGGGGSGHRDSNEDRIEVYVQKKPTLKGPPTKPKPNISEMARRAHSSHSKQCFLP